MGDKLETDRTSQPSESPEPELERRELSAADALERIRAGQTVKAALIRRLVLTGEFSQPVRLKNCTLLQLEFDAATFQGEVALVNCTLDRLQFSRRSVFQDGLNLGGSSLSRTIFRQLTIQGSFNLGNGEANGQLVFNQCRFEGPARFWELDARGWLDFKECEFAQPVDLRSIHVAQGLIFQGCRFADEVLLRGATISKKLDAGSSRFEGLLDLGKAKLHDFVYLEGIEQGEYQSFAFLNALAERILIQPAQLVGRLASEQAGQCEQAMHEYGLLKRSFQNLHRFDQEDWAFYRFKVNQRRGCGRSWWRPWTKLGQLFNWLFLDLGCGYGTNPFRAVRAAGVIILAFALIYAVGIEQFYVENRPFPHLEIHAWPNRILTSLLTSVSVFTSGLSGVRNVAKGWMNVPLIVESVLGTLLWGLFIVAFSRKVIR